MQKRLGFPKKSSLNYIAFAFLVLMHPIPVSSLTIVRDFQGGTPPDGAVGGGTLEEVFNAAADWWEDAIDDPHEVTIHYSWGDAGSSLAVHRLDAQGGDPNRETEGTIIFSDKISWYIDSSPDSDSEFLIFTPFFTDLGGGTMNVGRVFTGPTGNVTGRNDLLTVAKHEIGHALGLASFNTAFQEENDDGDIDILVPLPHSGAIIDTTNGAHLDLNNSLMWPSSVLSTRKVQSAADILANAQISAFVDINTNPHMPGPYFTAAIPNLSVWGIVIFSILLLSAGIWNLRKQSESALQSFFLCCLLILQASLFLGSVALIAGEVDEKTDVAEDVRKAALFTDHVIIGEIVSMVDSKPEANSRKHLETHWVFVEESLKGFDIAGEILKVRPRGLYWQDGERYVLFLNRTAVAFYEADSSISLEANDAQIVREEIKRQKDGVKDRLTIWLAKSSFWKPSSGYELAVGQQGNFRLSTFPSSSTGKISSKDILHLVERLERAALEEQIYDDADSLNFQWRDQHGKIHTGGCSIFGETLCSDLSSWLDEFFLGKAH